MNTTDEILKILREHARLEAGLTESELSRAEETYNFRFPPDLRQLLGMALPLDLDSVEPQHFPDWRQIPNDHVQMRMKWGLDGVLFDVEHNDFWSEGWGERPANLDETLQIARREFAKVPKIIPIYWHRFLPAEPCESGNPVFLFTKPT